MHELKHKIFRRKTRITGLELKYLSDAVTKIIPTTDLFEISRVIDMREYVKSDGQTAANTDRLYKTSGIEGSNSIVNMGYWLETICGMMYHLKNNWHVMNCECVRKSSKEHQWMI